MNENKSLQVKYSFYDIKISFEKIVIKESKYDQKFDSIL